MYMYIMAALPMFISVTPLYYILHYIFIFVGFNICMMTLN